MTHPVFVKPKQIVGNKLIFRNADTHDAAFILALRTSEIRSIHLSKTSNAIEEQIAWLNGYAADSEQVYFMILDRNLQTVGTVRLYDRKKDSFCWGSWILKPGTPSSYAIESALLVYRFGLSLRFRRSHFDVRKANVSVWRFHERFGAVRTGETAEDFLYNISMDAISASFSRYEKYLPDGCIIETPNSSRITA
jgi:RimJ/RimL family protein N-acetyltransferase